MTRYVQTCLRSQLKRKKLSRINDFYYDLVEFEKKSQLSKNLNYTIIPGFCFTEMSIDQKLYIQIVDKFRTLTMQTCEERIYDLMKMCKSIENVEFCLYQIKFFTAYQTTRIYRLESIEWWKEGVDRVLEETQWSSGRGGSIRDYFKSRYPKVELTKGGMFIIVSKLKNGKILYFPSSLCLFASADTKMIDLLKKEIVKIGKVSRRPIKDRFDDYERQAYILKESSGVEKTDDYSTIVPRTTKPLQILGVFHPIESPLLFGIANSRDLFEEFSKNIIKNLICVGKSDGSFRVNEIAKPHKSNAYPFDEENWWLFYDESCKREKNILLDEVNNALNKLSLKSLGNPLIKEIRGAERQAVIWADVISDTVRDSQKKKIKKPAFILCLIYGESFSSTKSETADADSAYIYVKQAFNRVDSYGLISQVITSATVNNEKRRQQAVKNTVLQIFAKMGSTLWGVPDIDMISKLKRTKLFIGIDTVKHTKDIKIVGYFAYTDNLNTKCYASSKRSESSDTFALEGLELFVLECFSLFKVNEGRLPDYIIIYRGGIAHTSDDAIQEYELQIIQDAVEKAYDKSCYPGLLFIICVPKCSMRIMTLDGKNPPPLSTFGYNSGCTREVKGKWEFYCTHSSVHKGATCSPTQYRVIYHYARKDKIDKDNIQRMTQLQCLKYFNWAGPVNKPATLMYASKLAKHSRCLVMTKDTHLKDIIHKDLTKVPFFL